MLQLKRLEGHALGWIIGVDYGLLRDACIRSTAFEIVNKANTIEPSLNLQCFTGSEISFLGRILQEDEKT